MNVWPIPHISFRELSSVKETRPTALVALPSVWASIREQLSLPIIIQAEPNRNEREFFEHLAKNLPTDVEVIYVIGDGVPLEVGKFVSSQTKTPLVLIPTALTSDKFLTWLTSVHEEGQATHVETGPADEIIMDMNVLKAAPTDQRAAAIVDVLSINTALLDWAYAAQKNQTLPEHKFVPWATVLGANLTKEAMKNAAAMGKGDPEALRLLVDLLCLTVNLDSQLGHRRISRGIEHLFANAVKPTANDISYAERVGAGILIASALYNKDCAPMRTALEAAGVSLTKIKPDEIRAAVETLPDYAKTQKAPYSILNERNSYSKELDQALAQSTLISSNAPTSS